MSLARKMARQQLHRQRKNTMRSLQFGTEQVDKDNFDIIYGGACFSSRGINRTEVTTFNRMMGKLEEVGKLIPGVPDKAQCKFELGDEPGEVLLEDGEYKLLDQLHDEVKWASKDAIIKAEKAYEFLKAAPTVKKVKSVPEEPSGDSAT